jgi:pimeloyl-ACP methyl ester carboxylesterase
VELALAAHLVDQLAVDGSACAGFASGDGKVRVDNSKLALFGHSMGATIAPLALAIEPRFGAAILSGAGGSWIENVLHKQKPIVVKPFAELLVGYTISRRELVYGDPALGLVQWAAEAADPPVYGPRIVTSLGGGKARHVMVTQGIVDHYILPPMANATALSFGLDLAGAALDGATPELARFATAGALLPLVGRGAVTLPVSGNVTHGDGSKSTAVVVQYRADGLEDGHEVAFQRSEPKYQYRCFLSTWARGDVPVVPAPMASEDPCP